MTLVFSESLVIPPGTPELELPQPLLGSPLERVCWYEFLFNSYVSLGKLLKMGSCLSFPIYFSARWWKQLHLAGFHFFLHLLMYCVRDGGVLQCNVEVRVQCAGDNCLLPPCVFQGWHSDHLAWCQVPLLKGHQLTRTRGLALLLHSLFLAKNC